MGATREHSGTAIGSIKRIMNLVVQSSVSVFGRYRFHPFPLRSALPALSVRLWRTKCRTTSPVLSSSVLLRLLPKVLRSWLLILVVLGVSWIVGGNAPRQTLQRPGYPLGTPFLRWFIAISRECMCTGRLIHIVTVIHNRRRKTQRPNSGYFSQQIRH